MFDYRVAWAQEEVKQYRTLVERMGQPFWDEAFLRISVRNAVDRKEALIRDLWNLEMAKCESVGCSCIDDEKKANAVMPNSGTEERKKDDRAKVDELLAGREAWKEKMDDFEEMLKGQGFGFM